MIKQWLIKLYGEDLSLRERLFRMILSLGFLASLCAVVIGFVLDNPWEAMLALIGIAIVMAVGLWVVFRYHKLELAASVMAVFIIWVLFPIEFFVSGGIDSGAMIWFVLGIIYLFLMFSGKKLYFFLASAIVAYSLTYYFAYWYPDRVIPMSSRQDVFYDSLFAIIGVGVLVGVLLKFQNKVYERERRLTEQQKEEIEQISLSKNAFFATMSHEIRTPINTIIGLNEMILREDISDEIADNAINIQNASKMLLALINDILDLSKIESGKMEIIPVQYETGAMFSDLVNLIWIRAHEKKLEFKIDISGDIPSMLYGDEVRIKQVLTNFLTNAVKYTKQGSVTLSAKSEKVDANTVRLRISVADTGMGIKKEDMNDLFQSFTRVDEKKNRKIEGTGLGLSISRQLIEMMGGQITVDSIYTKGSVFTIVLEQKIVDESPIGTMDFMLKKKVYNREKYKQSFEAPDARVLIVDDNEMNLIVACKLLRDTKVQIETATSGAECLEKTKNKFYNVIFMDHMMPEMNGIETLKRVRTQENGMCRETPVVALTANAMSGAAGIYKENGFQGYLAKPINGALFEATLIKYLPEELIEYSGDMNAQDDAEESDTIRMIAGGRKKPVCITTDCVCDLPKRYVTEFDIKMMYYYVYTEQGRFCDIEEITSDNLLEYLAEGDKQAHSGAASVREYETFFANALADAEQVIHITIGSGVGEGYQNAKTAAGGFGNVHVIDSGHLSSGMGLLVLYAASLVKEGVSAEEICEKLIKKRERISTSFIIPTPEQMYRSRKVSKRVMNLCMALQLHPVLGMKQHKITLGGVEIGRMRQAYRKYIRHQLKRKKKIDDRVVFITYAGCSVKLLEEIQKEVAKHVRFENVIIQKASATISSNCGRGAFGLLFFTKK